MLLKDKGICSSDLKSKIDAEKDVSKLEEWVKLAANSSSVQEFEENM